MSNIVQVARNDGRFGNLVAAMETAHLLRTLQDEGPFTLFAPTDDAFGVLPPVPSQQLYTDEDHLKRVIHYHIVPGVVEASDLPGLDSLRTLAGHKLRVRIDGDSVYIGGAEIEYADIHADNGVIHVIDRVLVPPE